MTVSYLYKWEGVVVDIKERYGYPSLDVRNVSQYPTTSDIPPQSVVACFGCVKVGRDI